MVDTRLLITLAWKSTDERCSVSIALATTNLFETVDGFAERTDLTIAEATFSEDCPFQIDSGSFILVIGIETGFINTFQFQNTFEQVDFTLRGARGIIFDLQVIIVDRQCLRDLGERIDQDGRTDPTVNPTWSLSCSMALNRSSSWISPRLASMIIVFSQGNASLEQNEDTESERESVNDPQITGYQKQQMEK